MFGGQRGIRKSYLKLTAIVCKDFSAALFSSDEQGPGNLLNLIFTLKFNCIHRQKNKLSVSAQSSSKCALLIGF